MRIPIIMVSGPVNSGKTLFGLTIDPNCRKPAAEVQPTTVVWDQEGSADSYEGSLNFEHKDTRAAVGAGVHLERVAAGPTDPKWRKILLETPDVNDSPASSMFRAWYLSLLKIPAGKYAVGVCDTFTPLQDGLVDWLRRHPEAFGRTANQYDKAASMFLWPDLKAVLSHILATDCRTRFDTFVMNVHLKNEWASGAKTGKLIAEGLDTLEKLATLHLELDRTAKEKGKDAPRVPSAIVKKERLVRFGVTGDDDRPILPPRMPHCTPDAIRKYIANPPDFGKLDAGERLPDTSMGDDDKLRMQAAIAENQRATEEAKLSALDIARRAVQQGALAAGQMAAATEAASEAAAQMAAAVPQTVTAQFPPVTPNLTPITVQQKTEMLSIMKDLFPSGPVAVAWLKENCGYENPGTLTETKAAGVLSDLFRLKSDRQQAALKTPAPATPDQGGPVVPPGHGQAVVGGNGNRNGSGGNGDASANGRCTVEQRGKIRDLTTQVFGESAVTEQTSWLQSIGVGAPAGLTHAQATARIAALEMRLPQVPAEAHPQQAPF